MDSLKWRRVSRGVKHVKRFATNRTRQIYQGPSEIGRNDVLDKTTLDALGERPFTGRAEDNDSMRRIDSNQRFEQLACVSPHPARRRSQTSAVESDLHLAERTDIRTARVFDCSECRITAGCGDLEVLTVVGAPGADTHDDWPARIRGVGVPLTVVDHRVDEVLRRRARSRSS